MATAQVFSERDQQNAELIGLLLMTAKMLQAIFPTDTRDAETTRWVYSMIHHAVRTYGDGKKLEADTLALARSLGMIVDQIVASEPAGSQVGLVH